MTMNFFSPPAFILISCLFAAGVHSNKSPVRQEPAFARLVEGQNVTMICTINFVGPKTYKWLKDKLEIIQSSKRVLIESRTHHAKLVIYLRIDNLTECDSGTYYCTMDNLGNEAHGEGTIIIVTRASHRCNSINIIFIAVSAGVIAVLCISLIIVSVCLVQRNKACVALQRQFVAYITEKSTESIPLNEKGKHKHREGSASSSKPEEKRRKRKPKQHNRMDPGYINAHQRQEMLP